MWGGVKSLRFSKRHSNALGEAKAPYTDMLPMIERVVEAFGPERCMWESDCPFQVQPPHTYDASLALIRDHADFLSSSDKEHLLVTTAERWATEACDTVKRSTHPTTSRSISDVAASSRFDPGPAIEMRM